MKDLCPCCGKFAKYLNLFPENPDTYLTDVSPNWVCQYKCSKCQNICSAEELIDEEEWINISRTRLIDKMLK
jgi:hypothetical protein